MIWHHHFYNFYSCSKMALKFPNVIYRELRGTGHLFPQTHSELLASIFEHVEFLF